MQLNTRQRMTLRRSAALRRTGLVSICRIGLVSVHRFSKCRGSDFAGVRRRCAKRPVRLRLFSLVSLLRLARRFS